MLRRAAVLMTAALVAFTTPRLSAQSPRIVDDLVDSATLYVQSFVNEFVNVVASERYVQTMRQLVNLPVTQEIESDFLLLRTPADPEWMQFRDVISVNRQPVEDRFERLTKVLSSGEFATRSRLAWADSARYNIGFQRTYNVPLLALGFLQDRVRRRFAFELSDLDPSVAPDARIVKFRERANPTVMRGPGGRDMFSEGRFWISSANGAVLKTELRVNVLGARNITGITGTVTTVFTRDPGFKVLVPATMNEDYETNLGTVTGRATYGRFRRFSVSTSESLK